MTTSSIKTGSQSRWQISLVRLFILASFLCSSLSCTLSEMRPIDPALTIEKDSPVWPPPPQTPRIRYLRSITGPGDIAGKKSWISKVVDNIFGTDETTGTIIKPYGVYAYSGRVYVTDPGANVLHVFDLNNNLSFRINKTPEEELNSPIGVAVDKNGDIYVSDSVLRKVFVFNKDGKYSHEIGSSDLFMRPTSIGIDEERLYVLDTLSHRVLVFNKKERKLLFGFGKRGNDKGEFNYPTHIFIGMDGLVYITDSMNFRILIFDKNGNYVSSFGKHGDGSGDFSKPKGLAVDSDGHIYVADSDFDNIQIFDKTGRLLLGFGSSGRRHGEMLLPAGIFIDENDMIYVCDSYNGRLQMFQYLKDENRGNR